MNKIIEWFSSWNLGGQLSILWFFIFGAFVFWTAKKLVDFAEVIITKSKFGGAFIGGTIVAFVTSIPELITEIVQASSGHPGAGAADDIGSNAFSVLLIAIGFLIFFRMLFLNKLSKWTIVTMLVSLFAATLFTILTFLQKDIAINIGSTTIGIIPLVFLLIYFGFLFLQYKFGEDDEKAELSKKFQKVSLKKATVMFAFWGVLLTVSAVLLNIAVSSIREGYSISESSIGGIFLAVTTSLPEVVAFFLFLRKKQISGAMGSLIGSHVFNLGILFFGDLTYSSGPTFMHPGVHEAWLLGLSTVLMLTTLLIHVLLSYKFKKAFESKKFLNVIAPTITIGIYVAMWVVILI